MALTRLSLFWKAREGGPVRLRPGADRAGGEDPCGSVLRRARALSGFSVHSRTTRRPKEHSCARPLQQSARRRD